MPILVVEKCVEERRESERYTIRLPVRIEVVDSEQQKEAFDLLTSNVSEGGTFIPTQKPIPKGTRVQIRLALINDVVKALADAQGCIMASGTVVRSGSTGILPPVRKYPTSNGEKVPRYHR